MKQLMIGNAHIDPVWFWRWQEGLHEVKATFRSALDRMNETPGFVFTCACAAYYQWVEENAPDMFEEIQKRVAEGRWVIAGGMWIQPDMNIPSGESLVRQLMISQRYFKEKFGLTASFGYNVDSFGHNGMMPQIYQKAGIDGYVWMRPDKTENPNIPDGAMLWESPDGSQIAAYRIEEAYTCAKNVTERIERLFDLAQQRKQPVMCFYGVGNHGGGPTIANLEEIQGYQQNNEQGDKVEFASPEDYFSLLEELKLDLPVWRNELQHHASGCYSTHSASKHRHRQTENALERMEKLGVLSAILTGHEQKPVFVEQAWKNLLFCEFHDAMGGCAAEDVLQDVIVQLDEACSIAAREENAALQRISWQIDTMKGLPDLKRSKDEDWQFWGRAGQGTPIVVFNPHEFETEQAVHIRRPVRLVRDDAGVAVPSQVIRAGRTNGEDKWDAIFMAKVPALGYRLYWMYFDQSCEKNECGLKVSETLLENEYIRAEFHPHTGALVHLVHKGSGLDVMNGDATVRLMDITHCDTWAHNVFRFDKEAGTFEPAKTVLLEKGPVRARLSVTQRFGDSEIEQIYTLYCSSRQLEVDVRCDLHEHHRMLKLCFPTVWKDAFDVAEISYGVLERTACGNEEVCQRWCAMQGEIGGLAILNDGRYSYSACAGELRLTIANTSIYADHFGQQQRDALCRYMDQGEMIFRYVLVPYAGSWREADLHQHAALLHQSLPSVVETYHEGPLPPNYCGIQLDADNIRVGALKRSENGKGYIVRLVESTGKTGKVKVNFVLLNRSLDLSFGAYEIKSLFIPCDAEENVQEVLLTEIDS